MTIHKSGQIINTSQAGWFCCRLDYEPLNCQHGLGHQLNGIRTADPCGVTSNSNHSATPLSLKVWPWESEDTISNVNTSAQGAPQTY